MGQSTKKAVIYARVSTADQGCDRQILDLKQYAERAGYQVIESYCETASGAKNDRADRAKVMKLAQARKIDVVLVTELSRWGRSTQDLIGTLQQLSSWDVSLMPLNGMQMDLSTPTGKLMATLLSGLAEFERDLIRERVISGLAAAKSKGVKLGRQVGQCPSEKIAPKVLELVTKGYSCRAIADKLSISKNTVTAISKRHRAS